MREKYVCNAFERRVCVCVSEFVLISEEEDENEEESDREEKMEEREEREEREGEGRGERGKEGKGVAKRKGTKNSEVPL